jgi:Arylsulfotransferase (ASST)
MTATPERHGVPHLTRRQLISGGAAGLAVLGAGAFGASRVLGGGGHATPGPQIGTHDYVRGFWSRPDLLPAPVLVIGGGVAPGYLAVGLGTAKGSVAGVQLIDHRGEPVFYHPISTRLWTTNPGVFRYRGEPVLTWWEGSVRSPPGYGAGEGVIVDGSYRELARVRAANGRRVDMHEYRLTPDGTALFTCYPEVVPADLSAIGGASNGRVLENIIQEVDIRTGKLLMEWRSLDHVPISETFRKPADPLDYLHANSIDIAADGNLLVSGRHTWSVYKLDRRTGEVIWRLGGKRSDFAMGKGSQYSWQHHARAIDPTTISVFDNGADGATSSHSQSRGVLLSIDEAARTVRLSAAYEHPDRLVANAMGSVEKLPNGNVLIGWGEEPCATEFAADGTRLSDAVFPVGQKSYRAFRLGWKGTPRNAPAIAARPGPTDTSLLFVSWNGATEVTHWQVHAGSSAKHLRPVGVLRRTGFETPVSLNTTQGYAAITALSSSGRPLGTSATVRV